MSLLRPSVVTLCVCLLAQYSYGQLTVLSSGNPKLQWKATQLKLIDDQLADANVKGPLREELEAQRTWLSEWKSGSLTDAPWLQQREVGELLREPTVDPNKLASDLRERLLGKKAQPTAEDTKELKEALDKDPADLGLQQLYLHWIDQRQYRDNYATQIVETAVRLAGGLEQLPKQTDETRAARAFSVYRAARALIHMESEEYVAKNPIKDSQKHEAQLLGFYNQIGELYGHDRPEFILLEIRMLRRDHWNGRALMLLETNAQIIERTWYLEHRAQLLDDLGWNQPAAEAESILQAERDKDA